MLGRSVCQTAVIGLLLCAISAGQNSWEDKNLAGEKAFQQGRLLDANRFFDNALRDAQQFGPNDVRLAPIYNNLGLVAFVQNNFISSEAFFEKSIGLMQAHGAQNPLLLPVLDNLTSLYLKQWAFGKAIQASWRACHIRETKFGPASLETAAGFDKLATLYLDNVRLLPQSPSDRLPAFDSAGINSTSTSLGCALPKFGSSIETSTALDDATKLTISELLFEKVLEIQEKAYGGESTRLVDVLENLSEVHRAQGETGPAEEVYSRTIAIVEKSFGPGDLKLALPLQRLAELKAEDGNDAEAEKLYQRALQIDEGKAGSVDPSLEILLTDYATLLEKMNRPAEAKVLRDRAKPLAEPRTLKDVAWNTDASVPYILRFEKSAFDQYTGFQQTCMLIRSDGRVRVEEQQQERTGSPIMPELPHPDNVPTGAKPGDTFNDRSTASHATKVFDSSLDANALQQLRAILSSKEIRDLQGTYPQRRENNSPNTEKISASILREDGVQNFVFPDDSARHPYDSGLKPLLKWLGAAEKRKGTAIKGAVANNCSPDAPKAEPLQFSLSKSRSTPTPPVPSHATATAAETVATLKVDVKLVPVHVVVRDAQGRSVGNLNKSDFQILDQDKPQVITQFSVEHAAVPEHLTQPHLEKSAPQPSPTPRYTAYLFDDLHLDRGDLVRAREAADRQLAALSPSSERAAVFTTSGQRGIDFTADRDKLHEILTHLESRKKQQALECPSITYHLADLIANNGDLDALHVAAEDALECAFDTKNLDSIDNVKYKKTAIQMAQSAAREKVETVRIENESLLRILRELVTGMSKAPGQRTIVVVSPGFFLSQEQSQVEIIDQAVRANVVVSALEPRGLLPAINITDPSVNKFDPSNPGKTAYVDPSDAEQQAVLKELADATGGIFFHNSNDIEEGFRQVAAAPEYSYVLAFAPHDVPFDGRFHKLKVTVSGGQKLTVQAREGYYAPHKR
ncbi:MAG: VWA domain-containing protein [Candidatus Sulfotelmatobacter sp.]